MTGRSATVCKFGAELCSTRCGLFLNLPKRLGDDLRIPGKGTDVLDNGILDLLSRERLAEQASHPRCWAAPQTWYRYRCLPFVVYV